MKKRNLLLMLAAGALVFGAVPATGYALNNYENPSVVRAAQGVVIYELDATKEENQGTNNSYATSGDVSVDDITWNVNGNATMSPWRLGGKSLTRVDRTVYSKTAFNKKVTCVSLEIGAASSITINSIKLIVSSNEDFSSAETINASGTAANTTYEFEAPAAGWTNKYYKFIFNVTVSGSSNKFVEFKNIKFYGPEDVPVIPPDTVNVESVSISQTSVSLSVGEKKQLNATISPSSASNKNVYWLSSNENVATVVDGLVTAKSVGSTTVTVTTEDGLFTDSCVITVSSSGSVIPVADGEANLSIKEYCSANNIKISQGSTIGDTVRSINIDEVVTATIDGEPNCGTFWEASNPNWRMYRSKGGSLTLSVKNGYSLVSCTINYKATDNNTGVLLDSDGNTYESGYIKSLDGKSATFTIGNTNTQTNGAVRIYGIDVEYVADVVEPEPPVVNANDYSNVLCLHDTLLDSNGLWGIRFLGNVKMVYADYIESVGFELSLDHLDGSEIKRSIKTCTSIYETLNDAKDGREFDLGDSYSLKEEGYFSFGYILSGIPADEIASIGYRAFAVINGTKCYSSPTETDINIVDGGIC